MLTRHLPGSPDTQTEIYSDTFPWRVRTKWQGSCSDTPPASRGKGNKREENSKTDECEHLNLHTAMTWAQRLKRVFEIVITTCEECGGTVKLVASIADPVVRLLSLTTRLEMPALCRMQKLNLLE